MASGLISFAVNSICLEISLLFIGTIDSFCFNLSNSITRGSNFFKGIVDNIKTNGATKIKNGYSIALMVDQRVGEGPRIPFFSLPAQTTTIPAQLALKFNCKMVPISLKRNDDINFEMTVHEPYRIEKSGNNDQDTLDITLKINKILEKMIIKNPTQWLWSHNRWKQ